MYSKACLWSPMNSSIADWIQLFLEDQLVKVAFSCFWFYLINWALLVWAGKSRNFRIFLRADGAFNLIHRKRKFDHTADALHLILGHKFSLFSAARTRGTPFKLSDLFGNLWSSLWALVRLDELVKPILKKPHREEFIVDKLYVSLLGQFVRAD